MLSLITFTTIGGANGLTAAWLLPSQVGVQVGRGESLLASVAVAFGSLAGWTVHALVTRFDEHSRVAQVRGAMRLRVSLFAVSLLYHALIVLGATAVVGLRAPGRVLLVPLCALPIVASTLLTCLAGRRYKASPASLRMAARARDKSSSARG